MTCVTGKSPQYLKKSRQNDHRCVCQICTCGKHKCPQMNIKFTGQTTNHHDYKAYQIHPHNPQKCHYHYEARHYDPNLIKSSYRAQYTPHKVEQHQHKQHYAYQPNTAKFDDMTQYKRSYVPNELHVERPMTCGHGYVPNKSRFEGKTTYNTQYNKKPLPKSPEKAHYAYQPSKVPFQGKTTYNSEYKPFEVERSPQTCAHGTYVPNKSRFEGQSSYKANYKAYKIEQEGQCPINQMPHRPRTCSPGKQHLYYTAQKDDWD